MLAGVLSYVALIALVAATILCAGMAMTRMTIERSVQPYVSAGYERAASVLQETIAADMQTGGVPYPVPTFAPLPATCANSACTYRTSEIITLTQTSSPTAGPSCDPAQTNCAPNVQTNAYVGESRLTARITVTVQTSSGHAVAARTGDVLLRTFASPPYAAIAGSREGAFDDVANAAAAGDDGGAPPATPNPCASLAPEVSDDTTVRVEYRNQSTKACSDGSTWADTSYSSHLP